MQYTKYVFIISFALLLTACTAKENAVVSLPIEDVADDAGLQSTEKLSFESPTDEVNMNSTDSSFVDDEEKYELKSTKDFESINFEGAWKQTETIRAYDSIATITNQRDFSFDFEIGAMNGANSGTLYGTAIIVAPNKAKCYIKQENSGNDDYSEVIYTFIIEDDVLFIDYEGDGRIFSIAGGFFHGGKYTQGEPAYINDNIAEMILDTDDKRAKMKALLGDKAYEQMLVVMKYGISYENDNLTYSGFISGAGQGVDLEITDSGDYYCLGYWLDSSGYTFYTNDSRYNDTLPEFMKIERENYELKFIYKDI